MSPKNKAYPRWRRARDQRRYDYMERPYWRLGFAIYDSFAGGWWAVVLKNKQIISLATLAAARAFVENAVGDAQ